VSAVQAKATLPASLFCVSARTIRGLGLTSAIGVTVSAIEWRLYRVQPEFPDYVDVLDDTGYIQCFEEFV
jgi:hypothetical protein